MVSIIVATAHNNVIGNKGDIPWRGKMPGDMKYFSDQTTNQAVIMGRTTYLSIPPKFRPLPSRINLVLSRETISDKGVVTFQSLQDAIDYGLALGREVFIAGGGSVYKEALSGKYNIDRVLRTLIDLDTEGDTFFPTLDSSWHLINEIQHLKDGKNEYNYCFQTHERVRL